MRICRNCGIKLIDETDKCVFCKCVVEDDHGKSESLSDSELLKGIGGYPDAVTLARKFRFVGNLILFLSIVAALLCATIDYELSGKLSWSIIVTLALIYANVIIQFAIMGRSGYRVKFVVLTALGVALFVGIDALTGFYAWSLNIVLPGAVIILDIAILVVMIVNFKNWQSYIMSQLCTVILSILLIVLYIIHVITWPYLMHVAFLMSVLLLTGTIILGDKRARSELKRRFHI